jgi:hypothetical protein
MNTKRNLNTKALRTQRGIILEAAGESFFVFQLNDSSRETFSQKNDSPS